MVTLYDKVCAQCGKPYRVAQPKSKYCSRACGHAARVGMTVQRLGDKRPPVPCRILITQDAPVKAEVQPRRGAVYEALRHEGFWSIRMGGVPVILYPGECCELPPPRPAQKDPGAACARGEEEETEKKETRIC